MAKSRAAAPTANDLRSRALALEERRAVAAETAAAAMEEKSKSIASIAESLKKIADRR